MTTGTLTRADLTEAVFQAVGLSRTDSAQMVEDMLEEVCGALAKGETVKLSSSALSRCARNPSGWAAIPRPAMKFRSRRAACWCFAPAMS